MNKVKAGVLVGKDILWTGVKSIVTVPEAVGAIGIVGLQQSLKYKGSVKTGLKGSALASAFLLGVTTLTVAVGQKDIAKERYEGYLNGEL